MRRVSEPPAPLPADVPTPVRELVEHTLATDPAARIPNGAALVAAVATTTSTAAAGRAPEPADERTATRVLPLVPAPQSTTAPLPGSSFAAAAVPPVLPTDDEDGDEEPDDRGRV